MHVLCVFALKLLPGFFGDKVWESRQGDPNLGWIFLTFPLLLCVCL